MPLGDIHVPTNPIFSLITLSFFLMLTFQGGDADTNGAVAGAMLACKIGLSALPDSWISNLKYKDSLMDYYER